MRDADDGACWRAEDRCALPDAAEHRSGGEADLVVGEGLRSFCAVFGFLVSLHKTNGPEAVMGQRAIRESRAAFPFERPAAVRKKRRSLSAVMDACPDGRGVIDAREQRIQRPKSSKEADRSKSYDSGKEKGHTRKHEMAVPPDGTIGAVSASDPGGAVPALTLPRPTCLLAPWDAEDAAAMVDRGDDGLGNDDPQPVISPPFQARWNRPLTEAQEAYHRHLSRYRTIMEHTNAPLNQFRVLAPL